jgi:mRNA interferase MazF
VVVSPDEINQAVRTVMIAPLTSSSRPYSWRVPMELGGKRGVIALDQMRVLDEQRLLKRLEVLDAEARRALMLALQQFFAW